LKTVEEVWDTKVHHQPNPLQMSLDEVCGTIIKLH